MVVVVCSQNMVLFMVTESISFETGKGLRICLALLGSCTEERSFYSSVIKLFQVDEAFYLNKKNHIKKQGDFHMKLFIQPTRILDWHVQCASGSMNQRSS